MARIALEQAGLTFRVRPHAAITLKEFVIRQLFRRASHPVRAVQALRGVDLEIKDGERVGVIGSNGAGKTTLLRLLAGIYPPTEGRRVVEGRISSLFELSLGFEQDATGWDNIAYRAYLQGETPRTLKGKIAGIAEFSELGPFLDMPVRCYSSGMLVRLAFSIATAMEPEILLVDEVLAAGDMAFQQKARARMQEMIAKARLIVLVSHDLAALPALCDRCLWLEQGRIRQDGPVREVIAAYTEYVRGAPAQAA
jgi:ABC-type polysaccharide/polyol phosphate transport system ATPase subunit